MKRKDRFAVLLAAVLLFAAGCGQTGSGTDSAASSGVSVQVQSSGEQGAASASSASSEEVTAGSQTQSGESSGQVSYIDGYVFSWSGGKRGHVNIECTGVREKDDQLCATIVFKRKDGSKSSFSKVKSLGETVEGDAEFEIPVNRNENTTIQALTTAMSSPHWVEYTIYVGDDAGGAAGSSLTENADSFDTEAPDIVGLEASGEVGTGDAEYVRIFSYKNGYALIEVDAGSSRADSAGDEATVYDGKIIRYLVVPDGEDTPAGLDSSAVIIRQPVSRCFVTSSTAGDMLAELGVRAETEEGSWDSWDLRELVKNKTDLVIEDSAVLAGDDDTVQKYEELSGDAYELGKPMLIDRSADEKSDAARAAWYKVYGLIFGQTDEADSLYSSAVS